MAVKMMMIEFVSLLRVFIQELKEMSIKIAYQERLPHQPLKVMINQTTIGIGQVKTVTGITHKPS